MNSFKFIGRYLALVAALAGVSTQTTAQVACGDPVNCVGGATGPVMNGPFANDTTTNNGGIALDIPDASADTQLSVPKFDRAAAALLQGVPENKIKLQRVEVTLTTEIIDFNFHIHFIGQSSCDPVLTYPIATKILANGVLGTSELPLNVDLSKDGPTLTPGSPNWDLDLTDYAAADYEKTECLALEGDLSAWIGPGDAIWTYRRQASANLANCTQHDEQALSSHLKGTVSVQYWYCVENTPPPPVGCVCDRPSPDYRRPGSLLLFPEFDTNPGTVTVLTVTNADCVDPSSDGNDIQVEFVYIKAKTCKATPNSTQCCSEENRTVTMTSCDTLTVLANKQLGVGIVDRGYVYAFAKEPPSAGFPNGRAISWDYLIGNLAIFSAFDPQATVNTADYSMNPVAFRANRADRDYTDVDGNGDPNVDPLGDGNRDLDGIEYDQAPNVITIPRFFGQDLPDAAGMYAADAFRSQLILIGLSGGKQFSTTVDFQIWNDNEHMESAEYTFKCWEKPYLEADISQAFGNQWMRDQVGPGNVPLHDLNEILGANTREAGWICVVGSSASSSNETIRNPAIYAVLTEHVGVYGAADLPWECGERTNGALLPEGECGDPDVDTNGDGVIDEGDAVCHLVGNSGPGDNQ
jgi:hypothetical protein